MKDRPKPPEKGGPEPEVSDADLVRASRRGERQAFEELVRRYERTAYAMAYQMVHHRDEASDIVQDAFTSAFRALRGLKDPQSFPAWFSQIVLNLCYNVLRRRGRAGFGSFEEEREGSGDRDFLTRRGALGPEDDLGRREIREAVREAIASLPPQQRGVVVLRLLHGKEYPEIAKTLKCSEVTARAHLFLAREKMKKALQEYMGNSGRK